MQEHSDECEISVGPLHGVTMGREPGAKTNLYSFNQTCCSIQGTKFRHLWAHTMCQGKTSPTTVRVKTP